MTYLAALADEIHEISVEHGWWEEQRNFGEVLALIHSEVSESLEEWRARKDNFYIENEKPEGILVELADVLIRVLDWTATQPEDFDEIVRTKIEFNRSRPYRHGNKLA